MHDWSSIDQEILSLRIALSMCHEMSMLKNQMMSVAIYVYNF